MGKENYQPIDQDTNPVFIIGLPRTASKWIMHALNEYTDYCVIHELHIKRLWRRGNHSRLKKAGRFSDTKQRVNFILELIHNRKLIGCFWRMEDSEYAIDVLDDNEMQDALAKIVDGWSALDTMVETFKLHYCKIGKGARHPVHFIFIGKLLKRYPESKVLFLTRPVSEIAASWRRKLINSNDYLIRRGIWFLAITFQVYLNYLLVIPILKIWKADHRVFQVEYPKLISNPEKVFQEICRHLEITYNPKMADSSVKFDSSYD